MRELSVHVLVQQKEVLVALFSMSLDLRIGQHRRTARSDLLVKLHIMLAARASLPFACNLCWACLWTFVLQNLCAWFSCAPKLRRLRSSRLRWSSY
jgi:hypothetical protein